MAEKVTCRIADSINDIHKPDWDSVMEDIPEGYHFYKTMEESGLKEFSFHYAVIHRGKKVLMIAPLFTADLNLDIPIGGRIQTAIQRVRRHLPGFMVVKTLFCGSPFGESGNLGLKTGLRHKENRLIIFKLAKAMDSLCRTRGIPFLVFKDFLAKDTANLDPLKSRLFFKLESLPSVIMDLDFKSMDEYMGSLKPSRRKDFRRKLKKAHRADIRIEVAEDVKNIIEDIYRLYLNTYNAGAVKFEKLTKDFFLNISRNMNGRAKFFLYYVNGRLGAFNLCFIHEDLFIDKFIGFDYDISYEHNLYFVSWYNNIEWALKNGMRYYQVGQTDYDPKIKLGGKPVSLYAYARHRNVAYNFILRYLAKLLRL